MLQVLVKISFNRKYEVVSRDGNYIPKPDQPAPFIIRMGDKNGDQTGMGRVHIKQVWVRVWVLVRASPAPYPYLHTRILKIYILLFKKAHKIRAHSLLAKIRTPSPWAKLIVLPANLNFLNPYSSPPPVNHL